jgi:hypothetical protein
MKEQIIYLFIIIFIYFIANQIFLYYKKSNIKENMEQIWQNSGNIKSMNNIFTDGKKKLKQVKDKEINNWQILNNNYNKIQRNKGNNKKKVDSKSKEMENISV